MGRLSENLVEPWTEKEVATGAHSIIHYPRLTKTHKEKRRTAMTAEAKLKRIKELLPEEVSSIFFDTDYCRLISKIKSIIEEGEAESGEKPGENWVVTQGLRGGK